MLTLQYSDWCLLSDRTITVAPSLQLTTEMFPLFCSSGVVFDNIPLDKRNVQQLMVDENLYREYYTGNPDNPPGCRPSIGSLEACLHSNIQVPVLLMSDPCGGQGGKATCLARPVVSLVDLGTRPANPYSLDSDVGFRSSSVRFPFSFAVFDDDGTDEVPLLQRVDRKVRELLEDLERSSAPTNLWVHIEDYVPSPGISNWLAVRAGLTATTTWFPVWYDGSSRQFFWRPAGEWVEVSQDEMINQQWFVFAEPLCCPIIGSASVSSVIDRFRPLLIPTEIPTRNPIPPEQREIQVQVQEVHASVATTPIDVSPLHIPQECMAGIIPMRDIHVSEVSAPVVPPPVDLASIPFLTHIPKECVTGVIALIRQLPASAEILAATYQAYITQSMPRGGGDFTKSAEAFFAAATSRDCGFWQPLILVPPTPVPPVPEAPAPDQAQRAPRVPYPNLSGDTSIEIFRRGQTTVHAAIEARVSQRMTLEIPPERWISEAAAYAVASSVAYFLTHPRTDATYTNTPQSHRLLWELSRPSVSDSPFRRFLNGVADRIVRNLWEDYRENVPEYQQAELASLHGAPFEENGTRFVNRRLSSDMQVVAFDENGDGSYQCDAEATDELDFRDIVGSAFDWEADPVDWETPGEDHGYHNGTANLAYRVFSPGPLRLQFIADVEELFMAKITSALAEAGIPDATTTTTTTTDPILPEATL